MEDLKVLELFSGIGGMHNALQCKSALIVLQFNLIWFHFSEFGCRKNNRRCWYKWKCQCDLSTQFPGHKMHEQQHSKAEDEGLPTSELYFDVSAVSTVYEKWEFQGHWRQKIRRVSCGLRHDQRSTVAASQLCSNGKCYGLWEVANEEYFYRITWSRWILSTRIYHFAHANWSRQHEASLLLHREERETIWICINRHRELLKLSAA